MATVARRCEGVGAGARRSQVIFLPASGILPPDSSGFVISPFLQNTVFTIYDAEGSVDVSYEGILPDLFREGQGVVVQGELEKGNHILAKEVLAKHDENYTPPEVEKAMEANHRRPASVYKDPAS